MDEYKNIEEKMKKTVSVLKDELNTVRAGRANAGNTGQDKRLIIMVCRHRLTSLVPFQYRSQGL